MTAAKESLASAVKTMEASLGGMAVETTASTAKIDASLMEVAATAKETAVGFVESMAAMAESLAPLALVLGTAFELHDSIKETVEMTVSAEKLARVLGTTTQAASILNVALKATHSSTEEFEAAAKGLDRQLKSHEADLIAAGLATRDMNGHLKDQQTLMFDALELLNSYKEGTDRNIEAQKLFGRGIQVSSEMLKLTKEQLVDAAKEASRFGLVVGGDAVAGTEAYRSQTLVLNEALEGLKVELGRNILPLLANVATFLVDNGAKALTVFKIALDALIARMIVFTAVSIVPVLVAEVSGFYAVATALGAATVAASAFEAVLALLTGPIGIIAALTAGIYLLVTAQTSAEQAADKHKEAMDRLNGIAAVSKEAARDMAKELYKEALAHLAVAEAALKQAEAEQQVWKGSPGKAGMEMQSGAAAKVQAQTDLVKELNDELVDTQAQYEKLLGTGGRGQIHSPEEGKTVAQDTSAEDAAAKAALAAAKQAAAEKHRIELESYRDKMQMFANEEADAKGHYDVLIQLAKEEQVATALMYGAESREAKDASHKIEQIKREEKDYLLRLDQIHEDTKRDSVRHEIDMEQEAADTMLSLGQINADQRLQMQMTYDERRYNLELDSLQQRLLLLDTESEAYAKQLQTIEKLKQEHDLRMKEMADQGAIQQAAPMMNAFDQMKDGWANVTAQFMTGQMTLHKYMKAMWGQLLSSFTQYLAKKLAATKLFSALEIAVEKMANGILKMLGLTAMTTSIATKTEESGVKIGASAATAGAGAAESQASIPYVGPILAIAAMAAIFAAVMAMKGKSGASAEGGYDIPSGINPLTQLHEKEMVLPAEHAETIRSLAGGGGGGTTIHFNISALDGHSVRRFFEDHGESIAASLRNQARDYRFGGR